MPDSQQQSFTNVQPIQQSFTSVQPISSDASSDAVERPSALDSFWKSTFLGKTGEVAGEVANWAKQKALANRQENQVAIAAGKEPPHGETANTFLDSLSSYGRMEKGATQPKNLAIAGGAILANTNPLTAVPVDAALLATGGYSAYKNAPEALKGNPEAAEEALTGASQAVAGAAGVGGQSLEAWSRYSPAKSVQAALSKQLSAAEADTPRPGGQIQPALNNTPREVLQHASSEGINLTPGQATESGLAQQLQKAGQTAAVGGKELASALTEQKTKFGQSINNFMDKVDPKRAGLSAESAGQTIQDTQSTSKSVSHDNASQGYKKIDYLMDKPVDPQPISSAWNQVKQNLPMGAEDSILAQTPRSMRAVVSDLLSGNPEGFKPTFNQSIQLRKFFRDLGDTEGLPTQAQAMYKGMSKAVDSAMESTASTANAADEWRSANAGWKDYATKYGDPQSILYKIGRQQDPTKIVTMLQNAPATDILTAKQEMGDAALEPLRRQVVQDIAQSRFNIGHDGIGGYSDSYLKALFPKEQVKELYLKGDLANRLKYDPNPSGTGSNLAATSQLTLGNQAKMSAAAKMSMPRNPLSFLPDSGTASSLARTAVARPISFPAQEQPLAATGTTGLQRPANLPGSPGVFKGGINPKGVEASMAEMTPEENITGLSSEISRMNDALRTTTRSVAEKAQLRQQINEYQTRLNELRAQRVQ